MRSDRDQDRERLEQEVGGETYTVLLRQLQRTHSSFRRFGTWTDVIALMRAGSSEDPAKEAVLLAILQARAEDKDPRWRAILLAIFWPGLDAIHNRKEGWDADEDERWQNVLWAFLQAVCCLDVSKRTDHLVQRIINTTIHRLHDEYRRVWNREERETPTDPEQFEELVGGGDEPDFDAIDLRSKQDAEIERLRAHADAGRISDADFLLLVGTRVYGKTAAQVRAYRLADNRLHELATWDMELLPIELSELRDRDVDLESIGFSSEELEKMLGATGTEGLADPDAVPEPPCEAVTKPGDLWVLGNHRLLWVHLTEKPVELAVRALTYSSRPGENVLDLFGGSGSTLIAAEKTGRRAFLMEIDPLYCDVIVRRWEEFTGREAERVAAEATA